MNSLVSVIIVSWNGKHWLQKSLPSVFNQTYKHLEIIVVDNDSTDGTKEWVKKEYPTVTFISLNENVGFAQANNEGFKKASGTYILFLNNDVVMRENAIRELLNVLVFNSQIAGAQSKLLLMDKKDTLDTIGAFLTPTGFLYHYCFLNKDRKELNQQIDIYTPKGAAMIFRKKDLDLVLINGQLFDADAFAYFEETDLAHRIWLSGKRIVYAYKAVIYHQMGGTSAKMDNSFIQYHSFKNRISSYIKNVSIQKLLPLLCIHGILIQVYAVFAVFKQKYSVAIGIEKAIFWNIININHTLQKRNIIQKSIRQVDDDFLWKVIVRNPPFTYYRKQMFGSVYEEDAL